MDYIMKWSIEKKRHIVLYRPSHRAKEANMVYCEKCKCFHEFDFELKVPQQVQTKKYIQQDKFLKLSNSTTNGWGFDSSDNYINSTITSETNIRFYGIHDTYESCTCKECGHTYDLKAEDIEMHYINREYGCTSIKITEAYLLSEQSKKGDDLVKVVFIGQYYTAWGDKLQYKNVCLRVSYNVKTGNSYLLTAYDMQTKKPLIPKTRYKNITLDHYMDMNFETAIRFAHDHHMVSTILEEISRLKEKHLGYKPPVYKNITSFREIALYNRMPSIDPYTYKKVRDLEDSKGKNPVAKIRASENFVTALRDIFKVKSNKTINQLLLSTDYRSSQIILDTFKDINNVKKLKGAKIKSAHIPFVEKLIEVYGENGATNKMVLPKKESDMTFSIIDYSRLDYYFLDSAEMYNNIIEKGETPVILRNANMKEIHDELSCQYNKIKIKNEVLSYSEAELKKYQVLDDKRYTLRYAKDTHELLDVGERMGICVGSYGSRAVSRACDILIVLDKYNNDSFECCIEKRGEKCQQIKARYNRMVEGELLDFIYKWLENTGLDGGGDFNSAMKQHGCHYACPPYKWSDTTFTVEQILEHRNAMNNFVEANDLDDAPLVAEV